MWLSWLILIAMSCAITYAFILTDRLRERISFLERYVSAHGNILTAVSYEAKITIVPKWNEIAKKIRADSVESPPAVASMLTVLRSDAKGLSHEARFTIRHRFDAVSGMSVFSDDTTGRPISGGKIKGHAFTKTEALRILETQPQLKNLVDTVFEISPLGISSTEEDGWIVYHAYLPYYEIIDVVRGIAKGIGSNFVLSAFPERVSKQLSREGFSWNHDLNDDELDETPQSIEVDIYVDGNPIRQSAEYQPHRCERCPTYVFENQLVAISLEIELFRRPLNR